MLRRLKSIIKWQLMVLSYELRDPWDIEGNKIAAARINQYYKDNIL